mmetsp:Transcript_26545/g.35506  ORF Transcript_26545/g.35506 Transcript_26545/m.35506 type:complete len:209 (+) Transcript_26545:220-846(+)
MVLLEDGGVLGQKSLLLHFDDFALTLLFLRLELLVGELGLALSLVDHQLLLPQALDLPLVFQLAHSTLLSIHLLQTFVLCELFHKLALEFFLHAFLFLSTLRLESELVLAGGLKLLSDAHALLSLGTLLRLGSLLALLNVKVISELLLEGFLGCTLFLLGGQLLEDLVTDGLSFELHGVDLVLASLLLLGVPAHHLVLVLVHLRLAFH